MLVSSQKGRISNKEMLLLRPSRRELSKLHNLQLLPKKKTSRHLKNLKAVPLDFLATDSDRETMSTLLFNCVLQAGASGSPEKGTPKSSIKSTAHTKLISDWFKEYEDHDVVGMRILIHFILLSSGCPYQISLQRFVDSEAQTVLANLLQVLIEDRAVEGSYPLQRSHSSKKEDKPYRRFSERLSDFLGKIVCKAHTKELLFDDHFLCALVGWVTAMSRSPARGFRHTAVFLACKLLTVLIQIHEDVTAKLDMNALQIKTHNDKRGPAKQLQQLQKTSKRHAQELSELETTVDDLFKKVYANRFRDVCPDIREICAVELGVWERKMAGRFLSDSYTMYHGWALHDKEPRVRWRTVQALARVYQDAKLYSSLKNFTLRYKERLLEMLRDVSPDVRREVASILKPLRCHEALSEEDLDLVYAGFLQTKCSPDSALSAFVCSEYIETAVLRNNEETSEARDTLYVRALVRFYLAYGNGTAEHMVHNFWGKVAQLQDWRLLAELLHTGGGLDDAEAAALVHILACAIRQGCSRMPRADAASVDIAKRKCSEHVLPKLPDLLNRFSTVPSAVSALADVVQCLDLLHPHETLPFEKLLAALEKVCHQLIEAKVLLKCLSALLYCAGTHEPTSSAAQAPTGAATQRLSGMVQAHVRNLVTTTEVRLAALSAELTRSTEETGALQKDLSILLLRLNEVAMCFNIGHLVTSKSSTMHLLSSILSSPARFDEEVVGHALRISLLSISWACTRIDIASVTEDQLNPLSETAHALSKACVKLFEAASPFLQLKAFFVWSDLLVLCSKQLSFTSLESLSVKATDEELNLYCNVLDNILDDTRSDNPVTHHMLRALPETHDNLFSLTNKDSFDPYQLDDSHLRVYIGTSCLISFFKLVLSNVVDVRYCHGYLHLLANEHYGKVVRHFMKMIRMHAPPDVLAHLIVENLCTLFEGYLESGDAHEFEEVKETGLMFVRSFGVDTYEETFRRRLLKIHELGIKRAFASELKFLRILQFMSSRLIPQDASLVYKFVEDLAKEAVLDEKSSRLVEEFMNNLLRISAKSTDGAEVDGVKSAKSRFNAIEKGQLANPISEAY